MTDQPLPLKPWDTEMDDELENILADYFERAEGRGWSEGVQAVYAYCWKLLAEKEVETKAPNELLHQTHKDLNEARAKIQEQASHVRVLTDALEIIIKEVEEDNLKISTFCRLNAKSALDRVKGK